MIYRNPINDPEFKKRFGTDASRWTKEELESYEKSVDAERVKRSELETADENGQEKGKQKERKAIAKKMLMDGYKMDAICNLTGLSEKEVEELKKQ